MSIINFPLIKVTYPEIPILSYDDIGIGNLGIIAGKSGAGKTTIIERLAKQALSDNKTVLYIDTYRQKKPGIINNKNLEYLCSTDYDYLVDKMRGRVFDVIIYDDIDTSYTKQNNLDEFLQFLMSKQSITWITVQANRNSNNQLSVAGSKSLIYLATQAIIMDSIHMGHYTKNRYGELGDINL